MRRNFLMIFSLLLLLGSCVDGVKKEYRQRLDLSGDWHSSLGEINLPSTTDEAKLGNKISDTLNSQRLSRKYSYVGVVEYEKEITIPKEFANKRLVLFMERTKPSQLWIDGDSVGAIGHLQAPHEYEITGLAPGKHKIKIVINNNDNSVPKGVLGSHAWSEATQTNWNGILGDFYIEASETSYIKEIKVYTDVKHKSIKYKIKMHLDKPQKGVILIDGKSFNTDNPILLPHGVINVYSEEAGDYDCELEYILGDKIQLWSEFNPVLYKINVVYNSVVADDSRNLIFGVRDFSTLNTQFTINGLKTFLRGTHDGCVFPLTGYAPMDKESWKKYFKEVKNYGFNHVRFHSWTPPKAAFEVADELGLYLEPELPLWGEVSIKNDTLLDFMKNEGLIMQQYYGNHPSFTMMALGNELYGDLEAMQLLVNTFRSNDNRHLFSFGANNNLGTAGQVEGEDFFVTCRVGSDSDSTYSTHVRCSFSFADAYKGGLLNGCYPSTNRDYSNAISKCTAPVVSHENGQFQVYPEFSEIDKYTGVLYPYNLELFKKRIQENGMESQIEDFNHATGQFVDLLYKADLEYCLRTPGFGGFQILDIKDYPGQGTALVGILDAFMETKGITTAESFKRVNNKVVPLAKFEKYCWSNTDTFIAKLLIANYSESNLEGVIEWKIRDKGKIIFEGKKLSKVAQGDVTEVADVYFPLTDITTTKRLQLDLLIGEYANNYDLWIYPNVQMPDKDVVITNKLSSDIINQLNNGASILYMPDHKSIESQSVAPMFTPDYWNYSMFKDISNWLKREVSPGTLSVLVEPNHPLFQNFPTEIHSDWQWYIISKNTRPLILDGISSDYKPIVQVVDNLERCHKLGMIFEFAVGKGKLLVSMCNLDAITNTPEGKQFRASVFNYITSSDFKPTFEITSEDLMTLFNRNIEERNIVGVKNITSYE